ncbi:MAG: hypothetical protein KC609_17370 [Myxococcales bacterium]|nr:hypothetical protein [Myxococcales bacterium]
MRPKSATQTRTATGPTIDPHTIGVVGATPMGRVVARFFAENGFHVTWVDVERTALYGEFGLLRDTLGQRVADGYMAQKDVDEILARIQVGTDFATLRTACCVVESVPENLDTKTKAVGAIEQNIDRSVAVVTTTYELGVNRVAEMLHASDRLVGMHLMGIGGTFQVAEIISAQNTSPRVLAQFRALLGSTFITPIEVSDRPGFLLNRLLLTQINEAAHIVYEGATTIEDVDLAIQTFTQQILGPLAMADLLGIDVVVRQLEALFLGSGEARYQPCALLKEFLKAGRLGRKSGRGFYQYG